MPLNNSIGSFSLGRDTQVVILHPLAPGGRIDLVNVTSADVSPQFKQIASERLNGDNVEAAIPAGYTYTVELDRAGSQLDDLQVLIDAAWKNAGLLQNGTVFFYHAEPNGSTSVYQLTDASVMVSNLGRAQPDAMVKQTITGKANHMVKV